MIRPLAKHLVFLTAICLAAAYSATAQTFAADLQLKDGAKLDIANLYGRVFVRAEKDPRSTVTAASPAAVSADDVKMSAGKIEVLPRDRNKRIDLTVILPQRCRVRIETRDGEIAIVGNFASVEAKTTTGTITTDIPLDSVKYDLEWTQSRPRYVADFELEKVKEKSAGRFVISGRSGEKTKKKKGKDQDSESEDVPNDIQLKFSTARGIVLINVPPNEVGSDLRERPLTEAAKAIVRSGDSLLMEAIRRAAPQYYGDYLRSLPPMKRLPSLRNSSGGEPGPAAEFRTALVRVVDVQNRAVSDLNASDFVVTESGEQRPIVKVERSDAPFNLVLLLDVSGSVENYITFIRKAARAFIETVEKKDRIAIIVFNDDVKVLSGFTTDKEHLSETLDSFEAGGGTAFYDALAYTVADVLRPMKGERTAIVILSDGEDNRSFLAFDSLLGSIQESGAMIYPLFVPTGLIQEEMLGKKDIDPMRKRYMSLTKRSEGEGEKLAKISGGVFFPISRLAQINTAYEDIVKQLRGAYSITFRSMSSEKGVSPNLRIRVKRGDLFVTISSVKAAQMPADQEQTP
ncbi:MAG: VWA domain-containing protein [Pyrinomonadaceae bacterium]|nr:VWA domain-containing protein [Pyrinomonadaceae bacterium]